MSTCNPNHPNCLKQNPVSGTRYCAGCGRSAADIATESSATSTSPSEVSDPLLVQALDVVSDDGLDSGDGLDNVVFADSNPDAAEPLLVSSTTDDSTTSPAISNDGDANVDSVLSNDGSSTSVAPSASLSSGPISLDMPVSGLSAPSVSLQAALTQLQGWATKWECQQDPYVLGLTQAIAQRDDLTMWASLSPQEHLPHPTSKSKLGGLSPVGRILTLVRNVLVFVPVAITWYAIGKATEAYGEFTRDNDDTPLNFLQFWQSGEYPPGGKQYLSEFWQIGDVARFDALLIALIVILTLVVGAIGAQSERSEAKFEREVESERLELSFVLANALHGRRSASPESIGESLAEALNDLTQAARDVNDVAARLERATVGVDTLGPKLDVLNQHTDRLVGQSVQSITASMSALVASVGQLNSAVSSNVTQVFADATANLEEVSAQFSRIAASMEVGAAQLRDDLESINRQLGTGNRGLR